MRCKCCNVILNDFESTRKHADTGEYIDECNKCFDWISDVVPVTVNSDLNPYEEITDDDFTDEETEADFDTWDDR